MNGRQHGYGPVEDGFEIITNDPEFYCVNIWRGGDSQEGAVMVTKLFPKEEYLFESVLEWVRTYHHEKMQ